MKAKFFDLTFDVPAWTIFLAVENGNLVAFSKKPKFIDGEWVSEGDEEVIDSVFLTVQDAETLVQVQEKKPRARQTYVEANKEIDFWGVKLNVHADTAFVACDSVGNVVAFSKPKLSKQGFWCVNPSKVAVLDDETYDAIDYKKSLVFVG